jgi:glycosyltransferase involved in cell wall biosynthesis
MNPEAQWVAVLGRRDEPADGVEDYCKFLGQALARHGVRLDVVRVPWAERGWRQSLRWLDRESRTWQADWILVQYTALGWSRRGFPFGALRVLRVLRRRGARCASVFHDSTGFAGERAIDRMRRAYQHWVMGAAYRGSERSVFTLPAEKIPWLSPDRSRATFIPVGANLPECERTDQTGGRAMHDPKTVAVYGVSESVGLEQEIPDIAYVIRRTAQAIPRLRLLVLGRGSAETRAALEMAVAGSGVELSVLGLLPADEVRRVLSTADVLLFVRGPVSTRRGSAVAGIACGLPVVGYESSDTVPPITEAGLLLAPLRDRDKITESLIRVLSDEILWRELSERSACAWRQYFSWDSIAQDFLRAFEPGDPRGRNK